MLKLEKIAKSRDLNVLLRSKPTLLTIPFLCAFGYALFIHLAALLLFDIAPFRAAFQSSIFAPVNVSIDLPLSTIYAAPLEGAKQDDIPAYLAAPQPKLPQLPIQMEESLLSLSENEASWQETQTFMSLESALFFNEFDLPSPTQPNPLAIYLSGQVSKLKVQPMASALTENYLPSLSGTLPDYLHFLFQIKVDTASGEICWWQQINGDETSHAKLAVEILKNIRFLPESTADFLPGEVEIVLTNLELSNV